MILHDLTNLIVSVCILIILVAQIRRAQTYRELWEEAERDNKEIRAQFLGLALAVEQITDTLATEHPDPEVRGEARKVARMLRELEQLEGTHT